MLHDLGANRLSVYKTHINVFEQQNKKNITKWHKTFFFLVFFSSQFLRAKACVRFNVRNLNFWDGKLTDSVVDSSVASVGVQ